ncbi:MAG TPA: c-type cytochrome [Gaiellaceae bacterium]|nr:c-type cytochrome [Gaiellaceae bacterium]HZU20444.1 c-type cytochrome [Gaiellaceae bacterium]
MLSTIALVVAGLSTGHKIGLAAVGAAFIVFSLISAFVLPQLSPNFPGRGMGWYVTICLVFFAAMLSAVIVFGREQKEATAAEQPTTTAQGGPAPSKPKPSGGAPQGNPQAGKAVFETAGCKGCHTLKAAGATGTVGPNLDQLKPAYARIVLQVTNGGQIMPSFKSSLSTTQIHDVAAFVYASTH